MAPATVTDNFPLRWESTGDQWWYASPIDWAAANGLYNIGRELLRLDPNLLIKLTSLRRIRRLETVWDDETHLNDVAKCRSQVARSLLLESEAKSGNNNNNKSLIRSGYGGWLLYTAASAGDLGFVKELLERDPLLVFGEGEYGVTDMLYAASRSKNSDVFRVLLDFALSPRPNAGGGGEEEGKEEVGGGGGGGSSVFKSEMMNRAVHAAARGGNVEILRELLKECSDVLVYRDLQGSTVLHSASGRGQVEVVKYLVSNFDIITATDNQGNTALHVAAYQGYLRVVEALSLSSPSLPFMINDHGNTFLHLAVAGLRTHGFQRLDRHIELINHLVSGKTVDLYDIINVRNNDGRTALHVAVSENIPTNLVELVMTVRYIDVNIRDNDKMTPLDILRQRPSSASNEILIKRLISAGGISDGRDSEARSALLSKLKEGLKGSPSPGTSFRIPDSEIFLYTGIEIRRESLYESQDSPSVEHSRCLSEISDINSCKSFSDYKDSGSRNSGSRNSVSDRLKSLFSWTRRRKDRNSPNSELEDRDDDNSPSPSVNGSGHSGPISLRQQYVKGPSLLNNKRVFSYQNSFPSPSTKKKFTSGLLQGVIRTRSRFMSADSYPSLYSGSGSAVSSPSASADKSNKMSGKQGSLNRRLMNQYLCFGAQRLGEEESNTAVQ